MRTIRNLTVAIIAMVSIMTQGCNESQQASTGPKTSAKAEKTVAMNYDLKDRDAFTVMGIQTRITSADEKEPGYIYQNLGRLRTNTEHSFGPSASNGSLYGVTFATDKKDAFDYLAGMSVHSDAATPDPNSCDPQCPRRQIRRLQMHRPGYGQNLSIHL